jgi:hypothetical protein
MICQHCKRNRVLTVNAKCSDCCDVHFDDNECSGYVPYDLNIGGGDYITFDFCLDCGQIQAEFPIL